MRNDSMMKTLLEPKSYVVRSFMIFVAIAALPMFAFIQGYPLDVYFLVPAPISLYTSI